MTSPAKLDTNRKWIAKYRGTEQGQLKTIETNLKCWIKKAQELLEKIQNLDDEKTQK